MDSGTVRCFHGVRFRKSVNLQLKRPPISARASEYLCRGCSDVWIVGGLHIKNRCLVPLRSRFRPLAEKMVERFNLHASAKQNHEAIKIGNRNKHAVVLVNEFLDVVTGLTVLLLAFVI